MFRYNFNVFLHDFAYRVGKELGMLLEVIRSDFDVILDRCLNYFRGHVC